MIRTCQIVRGFYSPALKRILDRAESTETCDAPTGAEHAQTGIMWMWSAFEGAEPIEMTVGMDDGPQGRNPVGMTVVMAERPSGRDAFGRSCEGCRDYVPLDSCYRDPEGD